MTLLELSDVDARYGDFQALFGVGFGVDELDTVAVIGANGAGKSTLLSAIMGTVEVSGGDVVLAGRSLRGVPTHERVKLGIALVPEGRRIFPSLSVEENLLVGAYGGRSGPWNVAAVLAAFPLLERLVDRSAGRLSGGEQQALAIGRALMSNPRLLLLDEVSLGLAPVVVKQLYAAITAVRDAGTTMLVVEQDVNQALAAADHAHCLLEGRISLSGPSAELSRDEVAAAYFGTVAQ